LKGVSVKGFTAEKTPREGSISSRETVPWQKGKGKNRKEKRGEIPKHFLVVEGTNHHRAAKVEKNGRIEGWGSLVPREGRVKEP